MRLGRDVLERDLYEDLGVGGGASQAEIRSAYRRQARHSHPDLNHCDPAAGRRMAAVNIAARVLLDPALRKAYDQGRSRHIPQPRPDSQEAAAPRSAWYDAQHASNDCDWVKPAPVSKPAWPANGAVARFVDEIRSRDGKLSLTLDEFVRGLRSRRQLAVGAFCTSVAIALLAFVYPRHSTPTTISPTALFP